MYNDENNNGFDDYYNTISNSQVDENYDADFYKNKNQPNDKSNDKRKKSKKIVVFAILLVVLLAIGGFIFFYLRYRDNNSQDNNSGTENGEVEQPIQMPNVELTITNLELNIGEKKKIGYEIQNNNGSISIAWSSNDEKIATVDQSGNVTGISNGNTIVTATYMINGDTYEKKCSVAVNKASSSTGGSTNSGNTNGNTSGGNNNGGNNSGNSGTTTDTTPPTLSVSFTQGNGNTWVNTDVVIKTTATDNSGSVTVEYDLNCTLKPCNYKKVANNTITISSEGPTEVMIRAIDKAGNKSEEKKVTVRIDKTKPRCALDVENNVLTAKPSDTGGSDLVYNGFSNAYSGTLETTKNLSAAGTYTYYVKDKAGNTDTCSLEVKSKTEYRYQDCTSCQAKCDYVWIKQNNFNECDNGGDNYKIENENCMERFCTNYNKCGTCLAYGQFSAWSEKEVTKTPERNVETRTIYSK